MNEVAAVGHLTEVNHAARSVGEDATHLGHGRVHWHLEHARDIHVGGADVLSHAGDGYSGTFTMDIIGQPVKATAVFSLEPSGKGCNCRIEHQAKCSIPLVGGPVAKFAQGQIEQGCAAEFAHLVDCLKKNK